MHLHVNCIRRVEQYDQDKTRHTAYGAKGLDARRSIRSTRQGTDAKPYHTDGGGPWLNAGENNTILTARIVRTVSRHAPTGQYRWLWHQDEAKYCPHCGRAASVEQTRDHVLLHCPYSSEDRPTERMPNGDRIPLLTVDWTLSDLAKYLKAHPSAMTFSDQPPKECLTAADCTPVNRDNAENIRIANHISRAERRAARQPVTPSPPPTLRNVSSRHPTAQVQEVAETTSRAPTPLPSTRHPLSGIRSWLNPRVVFHFTQD
ncbi:hypothetical protein BDN72DRAFT_647867 [Pluteus cervinus]|uniref:Uncharacterized protein n=1 Tax=Pluteus cervinus TaxID=181527 RepID=A0ACD3A094_9AGAR|nr:hypothetical protein BDN72DRAFT_647867 [Pluteus cervinus]